VTHVLSSPTSHRQQLLSFLTSRHPLRRVALCVSPPSTPCHRLPLAAGHVLPSPRRRLRLERRREAVLLSPRPCPSRRTHLSLVPLILTNRASHVASSTCFPRRSRRLRDDGEQSESRRVLFDRSVHSGSGVCSMFSLFSSVNRASGQSCGSEEVRSIAKVIGTVTITERTSRRLDTKGFGCGPEI
jgi:hypothetical protein